MNLIKRNAGKKLVLHEISSSMTDPLEKWQPRTLEETYTAIDLSIGMSDGVEGENIFYVKIATPEALRRRARDFLISDHRVIVIDRFDFVLLRKAIEKIIDKCSRSEWDESCLALQRYFAWEYEDYIYDGE
jgi:Immunity protein 8